MRHLPQPHCSALKADDPFKPGALVRHPNYGLGRIVSISGLGSNRRATIKFTHGEQKTFVLEKSPIEVVKEK